jgi:hypothetical protein
MRVERAWFGAVLVAMAIAVAGPGAAAAGAAPRWLPPTAISGTEREPYEVQIAIAPDGEALAVWNSFGSAPRSVIEATSRPLGGEWSAPEPLAESNTFQYSPTVAFGADGSAVVAWEDGAAQSEAVEARTRSAAGIWAPAARFGEGNQFGASVAAGIGSEGEAVVAWNYLATNPGEAVLEAATSTDGHWSEPSEISGSYPPFARSSVSAGPEGGAVVAWATAEGTATVNAATVSSTGAWAEPETLAELHHGFELFEDVQVAGGSGEEPIVAWRTSLGESVEEGAVESSTLVNGAWSEPETISPRVAERHPRSVRLAVGSDGVAAATWIEEGSSSPPVEAAVRSVGGTWSATTLTAPGEVGSEPQVAVAADGSIEAIWNTVAPGGEALQLHASRLEAGGWGAAMAIPGGPSGESVFPRLATDQQGDALSVWSQGGRLQASVFDVTPPRLDSVAIPATGTVGEALGFSASTSDAWSGPASVSWDFGDGTTAAGPTVTHVYAAAGTYQVTVTATDGAGNTTASTGTVVVPAPASPPDPGSSTPAPTEAAPTGPPPPAPRPARHPSVKISHRPGRGHGSGKGGGKPRYAFRFYDEEPGATYLCSLDGSPFRACGSPKVYRNLKPGRHVFAVKSVDAEGEASPVRAIHFVAARRRSE